MTIDIKSTRRNMDLDQYKFGQLIGVSKQTISNWERGKVRPSVSSERKLKRLIDDKCVQEVELDNGSSKISKREISEIMIKLEMDVLTKSGIIDTLKKYL